MTPKALLQWARDLERQYTFAKETAAVAELLATAESRMERAEARAHEAERQAQEHQQTMQQREAAMTATLAEAQRRTSEATAAAKQEATDALAEAKRILDNTNEEARYWSERAHAAKSVHDDLMARLRQEETVLQERVEALHATLRQIRDSLPMRELAR